MLNAKEIRSRLRHGDIKKIADELNIDQRIVSEVFNRGWHPALKNAVLNEALKLLEEDYNGESDLIERAEELNLNAASFQVPTKYKKSRQTRQESSGAGSIIILSLVGLILAWFFIPGLKDKIKAMLGLDKAAPEQPAS
jgi:hypothetical protein